jgi:hypothetical protein
MVAPHVEYVGFTSTGTAREYTLRVRPVTGEPHDVKLSIPNEAFLTRRIRYQDAPDVCFLRLQREMTELLGGMPEPHLRVTDQDLEEYRVAHAPRAPQRRPRTPPRP